MGVEAIRRLLSWIRLNGTPRLELHEAYRPVVDHVLEIVQGLLPGRHYAWKKFVSCNEFHVHFELDEDDEDLGTRLREAAKNAVKKLQRSTTSHWSVALMSSGGPDAFNNTRAHFFAVHFEEHDMFTELTDVERAVELAHRLRQKKPVGEKCRQAWRAWDCWPRVTRQLPRWALCLLEKHGYI
jgi:hypothetical protein